MLINLTTLQRSALARSTASRKLAFHLTSMLWPVFFPVLPGVFYRRGSRGVLPCRLLWSAKSLRTHQHSLTGNMFQHSVELVFGKGVVWIFEDVRKAFFAGNRALNICFD